MSCCGGTKMPPRMSGRTSSLPRVAVFRYEGTSALTVIGRATNQRYHFARAGDEVAVDWRDQPSVAQVPKLREIRRG